MIIYNNNVKKWINIHTNEWIKQFKEKKLTAIFYIRRECLLKMSVEKASHCDTHSVFFKVYTYIFPKNYRQLLKFYVHGFMAI